MKCSGCAAENHGQARFCMECGAVLMSVCAQCAAAVPADARFCPACGRPPGGEQSLPTAKPASQNGRSERKYLTVLFGDFLGFTALADKLDAEEVHELMNELWGRLDTIITRHGGTIDKHIGDAVMALFGAEHAQEEDPEHAVRAALEMQEFLHHFQLSQNHRLPGGASAQLQPELQMRIAVHTGPVLLGLVGTTKEFTATGDTVNLASRLQTEAPPEGVLISHHTFRHVCGLFDIQPLSPVQLKGKDQPIEVYLVSRAKPRPLALRWRGIQGIERRMIGREQELKRLQIAAQRVSRDGEAQFITITGEAGIGKSCLLQEFQKWVDLLPQNFRLFSGRATAEMSALPFSLLRDALCGRFGIQENDPPPVARQKLENGLLALFAGGQDAERKRKHVTQAHFIGQLLGLDFSDNSHIGSIQHEHELMRHRAFVYLGRFFERVSRGSRLPDESTVTEAAMLVLEDIQWADDGSLDFIEYLFQTCRGVPLLIVCVARPELLERRPAWGRGCIEHSFIDLSPLASTASWELAKTLLRKASSIPQQLLQLIAAGAGGNPFYIEEIVRMLIDDKVIIPGAEHWEIEPSRLVLSSIPPTLAGVLQARLDGLTSVDRTVLQRAAVVGSTFWDSAIRHLSRTAGMRSSSSAPTSDTAVLEANLPDILAALQTKDLILRHDSSAFAGAVEYSFRHELLRNATYETVLRKARRLYHSRAGEWFVQQGGARVMEFAGLVAWHFEKGERLLEASEWYGRAAQQARASYEPVTAIDLFQKAKRLLPPDWLGRERLLWLLEWQEGLCEALGAQARFTEALEAANEEHQLAQETGDFVAQARACNNKAFLQERVGSNQPSIESAQAAASLAEKADLKNPAARRELLRALNLKAWATYRLGDSQAVLELASKTAPLCAGWNDRRALATTYKLHGVAHLQLGRFAQAEDYFRQGLALARESDDRRNAAAMLSNLGECARLRGDFRAAVGLYQRALSLARSIGHRESELIYLSNLAGARLGLRQFKQAEADLREVVLLAGHRNTCSLAESYAFLSTACFEQGKFADAWEAAELSLQLTQHSGNFLDMGGAWLVMAVAASGWQRGGGSGLPRTAAIDPRAYFEESVRIFQSIGAEGERARALRAWGIHELETGHVEESYKLMKESRAIFARLGIDGER